jgi:hypothetical protein
VSQPASNPDCPNGKACEHQETVMRHMLANAERALRRELMRWDLSKRQLVVLLAILDTSMGQGRQTLIVPRYDVIADLVGFASSHTHTTIKELLEMRLLEVKKLEGALEFRVQPNCDLWHCRPRVMKARQTDALEWIKHYNGAAKHTPATPKTDGKTDSKVVEFNFPPRETPENFSPGPGASFSDSTITESVKATGTDGWLTELPE